MHEPYRFDETDREVVKLAMYLLAKIWHSSLVPEQHKAVVASLGALLKEMPGEVQEYFNASVTLTGPRRKFGDHEIYHYWTVESQNGEVRVKASGHFYRPSSGGDTFTSFSWCAIPGSITDCRDYFEQIRIVDDAQPFGAEVNSIDLSQPGYTVSILRYGESVYDEEEDDVDEDDEGEYEEVDIDDESSDSAQLAACLWAFMDADSELIYALAGRVYALDGTEEDILRSLKVLSRHDFRTVQRAKVPARFGVVGSNVGEQGGLAAPSMVNDPDAALFNELLDELEESLPPIQNFVNGGSLSQTLGDDPLTCLAIVYEDASGNCRAIVDPADLEWLRSRTSYQ